MKTYIPHITASRPKRRFSHRAIQILFALVLFLPAIALPTNVSFSQQLVTSEYSLKAVYLYNFLQFSQGTGKKQPDMTAPLVIGVVGESPFGDTLADLQQSLKHSGQNNLLILTFGPYQPDMDFSRCHLLFISTSEKENFPQIFDRLQGRSILTVGENSAFLDSGGMINLLTHKGKIRWEINRNPIRNSGIRLNSKLLDIAVRVIDAPASRNINERLKGRRN